MASFLLAPPVVFLIYLVLAGLISVSSKWLAATGKDAPGKHKSYACGEEMPVNRAQPDYSQFFQFAFFFTIMHVIVLVVATDPAGISLMSGLYLTVTVVVLFMLFRR